MRRILIDERINQIAEEYALKVFEHKENSNFVHPKTRLKGLVEYFNSKPEYIAYRDYVVNIKDHYEDILKLKPDKFDEYNDDYFKGLSDEDFEKDLDISEKDAALYKLCKGKRKFYELVLWAMRYDDLRELYFWPYAERLNIRTCVYCNAQYAIVLKDVQFEKKKKKYVALLQLDHYYPKSKYPFLCTSFYNLQPSCANCNSHKSDRPGMFNLYTRQSEELDPFRLNVSFGKDKDGHVDMNEMEIKMESADDRLRDNHNKLFLIDDVYSHFNKEAQEIKVKLLNYNDSYRQQLEISYHSLFSGKVESPERFFWGHELDENKVFERPLNKLAQDMVKTFKHTDKNNIL